VVSEERVAVHPRALFGGAFAFSAGGREYRARGGAVLGRGIDRAVWMGKLEGSAFTSAVTVHDGAVAGVLYAPEGHVFQILPAAYGAHFLVEVDPEALPPCGGAVVHPAEAFTAGLRMDADAEAGVGDEAPAEIAVLELYTAQALVAAGGQRQIEAQIQNAVDATNAALADSGVRVRLRLAHTALFSGYSDSGNTLADLQAIAESAAVEALRTEHQADLVGLWIETARDAGGRAYRPVWQFGRSYGFHVTGRLGGVNIFTYAHEVAHNLGTDHNREDESVPTAEDPYPFARGYRRTEKPPRFITIESYYTYCDCPRVPMFATPLKTWQGVPVGVIDTDNVRMMNIAAPFVAAYAEAADACSVSGFLNLCLQERRFKVEATWRTPDATNYARAVYLTSDTGFFWFFNVANVEVVVKVVNGCGLNGHYWLFASGLTDVEVRLTVTDTKTGTAKVYVSPQGRAFEPIQDTSAFATCP
jgi:hypothetical protein